MMIIIKLESIEILFECIAYQIQEEMRYKRQFVIFIQSKEKEVCQGTSIKGSHEFLKTFSS